MRARIADGTVRPLTHTAEREEGWPYWSEHGRRLVFETESAASSGRADLMLWDPESATEAPLTETPRRDERWPGWSPDGAHLVFAFVGGGPAAGVAIVDLEDRSSELIARSGPEDFFLRPSFAPDGGRLVAQRRGPEGHGSSLWLLSPQAPPRALTDDPRWFDMKPWFTRDGTRIVFSRRSSDGGPRDIVSMAADGRDPRTMASTPTADDHSARPSPSRDEIAFVSDRSGGYHAFLADLDGAHVRRLTDDPDRNHFAPRWSPDGERLVLTTVPAGTRRPRLADRDSIERSRVLVIDRSGRILLDVPGLMPDWMPPWT
jgi:Tol biopolymer transport system component